MALYVPPEELGFRTEQEAIEYARKAGFQVDDQEKPKAWREDMPGREFVLQGRKNEKYNKVQFHWEEP